MAAMSLRNIDFWQNHERRVLCVLRAGLQKLSSKAGLIRSENALNRELYFCILEAIREYVDAGGEFPGVVMYEASNQPHADDLARVGRENKRPDLQFPIIDHQEKDARASAKQFVVECKRVGDSGRTDWVLNRNYVLHGVIRFRDASFGYGKGTRSGAMVGYIENTSAEHIAGEIFAVLTGEGIDSLVTEREGELREMTHNLCRAIAPTPYAIRHLWINLVSYNWN